MILTACYIVVAFVGALELNGVKSGEIPSDFRNEALDFGQDAFYNETKLAKRRIEPNQGHAQGDNSQLLGHVTMMGILVIVVHEHLGGEISIVEEI